jgi:hypothetical protein
MFTNRRISCSLGKTINIGNFESLRIDIETSADITDEIDIQKAKNILYGELYAELNERCEGLSKPKLVPRPPSKKL